jgi:hypothetical protein
MGLSLGAVAAMNPANIDHPSSLDRQQVDYAANGCFRKAFDRSRAE